MTFDLVRPSDHFIRTSASGAMIGADFRKPLIIGLLVAGLGTSTNSAIDLDLAFHSHQARHPTTAGYTIAGIENAGNTIAELRRLSGLTWDQLARLCRVSRRSLHFWASGKPMSQQNEEHIQRLLAVVRIIDRGSATLNRAELLQARDGELPFDLLAKGVYDRAIELLGSSSTRQTAAPSGSRLANTTPPRRPEELVGALQDRVHSEAGEARSAKAVRTRGVS